MHLRSASMPSQQQQAGVLESIEPPLRLPDWNSAISPKALAESWQNPPPSREEMPALAASAAEFRFGSHAGRPCQPSLLRPLALPSRTQGAYDFMRDHGVRSHGSIGPGHSARGDERRNAQDPVAGGRPGAWLCDDAGGGDDRGGGAGRAAHASGNRIRLCAGGWLRASHPGSSDPRDQDGRWLPHPPETPHAGGKPGDAKSRILITYVVEKGKPLASTA